MSWFLPGLNYTTLTVIISVFVGFYFYLKRNFNYWSSQGINGPKPLLLFGNLLDGMFKTYAELEEERIAKYGKLYGIFLGSNPLLVVSEPELIKNILIKDFNVFVNRSNIKIDHKILSRGLLYVQNDEWKQIRSVVSPTFTSGKIKKMHQLIEQCVKSIDKVLERVAKSETEVEMKKLMGSYSMDVIASCAFATKSDTHNDPNNPFIKNAIKIMNGNGWRNLMFTAFKPLMKLFKISILDPEVMGFFENAISEIIKQRRNDKNGNHNDFLQLMLRAQKNVVDRDDNNEKINEVESHYGHEDNQHLLANNSKLEITNNDILANSFIFMLAGYETTATLLSHLIYSLAINQDCQQKLLDEVLESDTKEDIDYETIVRLPYLDACVSETLRLYNPSMMTLRITGQEYKLGDTGLTLPKGASVQIPIHAIHHNPEFYPEPHKFNPDRFLPENKHKLIPYTYLPFGAGPRNCVGMRFALFEAKTAIVRIITKYKFIRSENTKIPLQFKKFVPLLSPSDITVGVELRN